MSNQFALIASLCWAVAAGSFVWILLSQSQHRTVAPGAARELEEERRRVVRAASDTYRRFEPLVDDLAAVCGYFIDSRTNDSLVRAMALASPTTPWRPPEFIASKLLEGAVAGAVVGLIILLVVGIIPAIGVACVIAGIYAYTATQGIKQAASQRIQSVKYRLPFAVDLMALMLEAGASFQEALKTVVRENSTHPLGLELGVVARHVDMGRPRRLALGEFQDRVQDQDVNDLVAAIVKGEELGTSLSVIMRSQADQMRLKRSQWGEKAAAEAQVQMTFPAMIVMLACMLLVLGPFVLPPLLHMF